MNLKATILAKKLKHAVAVLRTSGSNDAVLHIADDGIECRTQNSSNSLLCRTKIDQAAFSAYIPDDIDAIGIDFLSLTSVLNRARAQDVIHIESDGDDIWLTRDIHQRRMPLLDPAQVKEPPELPDLPMTMEFGMSGQQFKDITDNASDVGTALRITTDGRNTTLDTASKHKRPEEYIATIATNSGEQVPTVAMYDIELLVHITKQIMASDKVIMRYATDLPCLIEYERGGVEVEIMLAPRIEDQ